MASQDRRDPDFNQMENENSEQQIAWVCNILQKEAEKPDDQKDFQLIQECSDYLKELLEEINSIPANRIPASNPSNTNSENPSPKTIVKTKKKIRIIAILIAALIAIFGTLTVAAKAGGYENAFDLLRYCFKNLKPGESMTEQGITIIKSTGVSQYPTIENFLESEHLPILYPTELPDRLKINEVRIKEEGSEKKLLSFVFSDPSYNMVIFNYYNAGELPSNAELLTNNGITFHLIQIEGDIYNASARLNGYEYVIQCENREHLIQIITHMEGNLS